MYVYTDICMKIYCICKPYATSQLMLGSLTLDIMVKWLRSMRSVINDANSGDLNRQGILGWAWQFLQTLGQAGDWDLHNGYCRSVWHNLHAICLSKHSYFSNCPWVNSLVAPLATGHVSDSYCQSDWYCWLTQLVVWGYISKLFSRELLPIAHDSSEIKTLNVRHRVISVWLGQYHGCLCPGSLRRQDISSHDIDYVEYVGPGLTWRRILSTCVMSIWSNDM